jgi:hypothetical protein
VKRPASQLEHECNQAASSRSANALSICLCTAAVDLPSLCRRRSRFHSLMISRSFSAFMRAILGCTDNRTNKEQKQDRSLRAARIRNWARPRRALDVPHRLLRHHARGRDYSPSGFGDLPRCGSDLCRESTPLERTVRRRVGRRTQWCRQTFLRWLVGFEEPRAASTGFFFARIQTRSRLLAFARDSSANFTALHV